MEIMKSKNGALYYIVQNKQSEEVYEIVAIFLNEQEANSYIWES